MAELSKASLSELKKRMHAELRSHEKAVSDLKSALNDLEAAERLLGRMSGGKPGELKLQITDFEKLPYSQANPFKQGTIRAVTWEVLERSSDPWLTTDQVREAVSKILKRSLSKSSVGVTLSRMKPHVRRRGPKVANLRRDLDTDNLEFADLDMIDLERWIDRSTSS